MNLEEAVKNLNNYIFAIDNFGTIDSKCCNNLYEPVKVILKELKELKKNQRYKKDFNGDKIFCLEYDKETLRDMVLEQQKEIKELKSNSIPKDKIREIIIEELPDNNICKSCGRYDVNGVVIKQKLIKVLEGE